MGSLDVSTASPLSPLGQYSQRSGVMSVEGVNSLDGALLGSLRGSARRLGGSVVVVPGELAVGSDVSDETVAVVALGGGASA